MHTFYKLVHAFVLGMTLRYSTGTQSQYNLLIHSFYVTFLRLSLSMLVDDIIEVLSKCIGKKWKELAHQLKFSPTGIDAIEYYNRGHLKEQICQFFYEWRQWQGKDASAEILIKGLRAAGLQEQLDSLEKRSLLPKGELYSDFWVNFLGIIYHVLSRRVDLGQ